ncbi:MAG: hypothetical protein IPP90_23550 [Gemmatimonadaceae bacterium]|nr:hypothetical protein [Gemmatimonadaceae bacterium]
MTQTLFRRPLQVALFVLSTAVAAACGSRADTARSDSASGAAGAPISDSAVGPGTREGTWQGTDAHSTWRAILDGPWITQIDEISLFTDSARATRQFRFDSSGFLATAREERLQTLYGDKAAPDTLRTVIELEWQRDSLSRSAKRVNGVDRLLQPFEVDNLRAHADDLRRAARTGTVPRTPGTTP